MHAQVAQLLDQLRAGDRSAVNQLIDLIYPELRRIAQGHLGRERPDHTLQPTALVHEAYLRLLQNPPTQFADRAHFLALVSLVMRRVLVEHARAHSTEKRGGGDRRVPWSIDIEEELGGAQRRLELLELEDALEALAQEKSTLAQLIEMRYFGGMTDEECAQATGRSVHAIRHEIRLAKAWLRRRLAPSA